METIYGPLNLERSVLTRGAQRRARGGQNGEKVFHAVSLAPREVNVSDGVELRVSRQNGLLSPPSPPMEERGTAMLTGLGRLFASTAGMGREAVRPESWETMAWMALALSAAAVIVISF